MQETIYVGWDLGSSCCQQTVMNRDGSVRFSRVIPTSERHLRSAFDKLGGEARFHNEAGSQDRVKNLEIAGSCWGSSSFLRD